MTGFEKGLLTSALVFSLVSLGLQIGRSGIPASPSSGIEQVTISGDPRRSSRIEDRIDRLSRRIDEELVRATTQHRELGNAIARLTERLDAAPIEPERSASQGTSSNSSARRQSEKPGLDEGVLIEAGFSASEARSIREAYDELEMEQLYLRNRAARDDWEIGEPLSDSLAELAERERALVQDLGEDAYDWLLYATDRPNRVRIQDVFGSSPAETAGLETGDVLLRYDEARVRNGSELQQATISGASGEWVTVEVLRNGRSVRTRIPRGPLGVRLEVDSARPPTPPPPD